MLGKEQISWFRKVNVFPAKSFLFFHEISNFQKTITAKKFMLPSDKSLLVIKDCSDKYRRKFPTVYCTWKIIITSDATMHCYLKFPRTSFRLAVFL